MRFFLPSSENGLPRQPISIDDRGLVLGRDTVLMRRVSPDSRSPLACDDRDRLISLLSILARSPVSDRVLHSVAVAAEHWERGDKALANLRLVFAGLPAPDHPGELERTKLAERCLDEGLSPRRLMKEIGLDTSALGAIKFNPNHVPAGNGRVSGQFASGQGGSVALLSPSAAAALLRGKATSILDPALDSALLARLAAFAARIATPTAVLGTLLIPTPNSGGVTEGTLPGAADIRFHHDGPAGLLALTTTLADGSEIGLHAESRQGFYVDVKTGLSIGRDFGGQMVLDLPALHLVLATQMQAEGKDLPRGRAAIDEDEPKFCPAPTPDKAHAPKQHVLDYEDDVHRRVNPLLPIPRGFAVRIKDPATGQMQYPDDCFRYAGDLVDGDMEMGDFADAKGEEYERLLKQKGIGVVIMRKLMDVSRRHLRAAESLGRRLKIYFAEPGAAKLVREAFASDPDLRRVRIGYLPPSKPKLQPMRPK